LRFFGGKGEIFLLSARKGGNLSHVYSPLLTQGRGWKTTILPEKKEVRRHSRGEYIRGVLHFSSGGGEKGRLLQRKGENPNLYITCKGKEL